MTVCLRFLLTNISALSDSSALSHNSLKKRLLTCYPLFDTYMIDEPFVLEKICNETKM